MKSSQENLRKRGKYTQVDLELYKNRSSIELIEMLNAEEAFKRSIAIYWLSQTLINTTYFTHKLISLLNKERSLYTKIEICKVLQKGDIETAKLLIPHLGLIGNNQIRILPKYPSKKKSYPLPRDIVARILAKMDCSVYPLLLKELSHKNELKISELIDAIGFMTFYNPTLATETHLNVLTKLYVTTESPMIRWKLIIAFSSFPIEKSSRFLDQILENKIDPFFKAEAKRSLRLIFLKINK